MRVRLLTIALAATLSATAAFAQDPPAQDPPQAGGGRGGRAADPEIRPFDRVITKDAKSDDGPLEFLGDIRKGVWSEVYNGTPVKVDAYRRNLQRAYVETLADRINGRLAALDDSRAFFRGELKTLDADLRTALARTTDRETRLHIDDVRMQIQRALDPTVQETAGAAATRPALTDEFVDVSVDPESCWMDNAIRARRYAQAQGSWLKAQGSRKSFEVPAVRLGSARSSLSLEP